MEYGIMQKRHKNFPHNFSIKYANTRIATIFESERTFF